MDRTCKLIMYVWIDHCAMMVSGNECRLDYTKEFLDQWYILGQEGFAGFPVTRIVKCPKLLVIEQIVQCSGMSAMLKGCAFTLLILQLHHLMTARSRQ